MPHEFITVSNRRWCVGCDLFQSKENGKSWWKPTTECERYTPYARRVDTEGLNHAIAVK